MIFSGVEHLQAHLEGQVGDHGAQVGVAAPLAQAVDRALDLAGPGPDRGQAVGHCAVGVVVGVDADRQRAKLPAHGLGDLKDLVGQPAAVGVAQGQDVRPGIGRGLQDLHGVLRIGLVPIEEVLGVEDRPPGPSS